ncbi:hypothetical protein PV724_44515 [Streptomyces europaeiscabiei]|uniref:hypothetical protein n=1 Tax=Streptomyces europaeiscabiei TaxID=146819 RepID=UPI0029B7268E|nr:hypothetical protein [Streptomyces europaeiscabiei]MDX3549542.1 hypothetical protein [Streptomyces europaeiscabiei]
MPQSSQTPEREIERLRIERDEVAAAAKRVGACLQQFMDDAIDPGTEALAAQYELSRILSLLSIDDTVIGESQYLSRFSVTPEQVHRFLASRLAEDVHLRYQQAIGSESVREAMDAATSYRNSPDAAQMKQAWRSGIDDVLAHIDPDGDGGLYPEKLLRLGETGGAR